MEKDGISIMSNDTKYTPEESVKEYLDYLDRSRRTNGKTRYQQHNYLLSKITAKLTYQLTDEQLEELEIKLRSDYDRKKEEYINYLDQSRVTYHKSRYEEHKLIISKLHAKENIGLTDDELKIIDLELKNMEENIDE